jgi:hypothetical protein
MKETELKPIKAFFQKYSVYLIVGSLIILGLFIVLSGLNLTRKLVDQNEAFDKVQRSKTFNVYCETGSGTKLYDGTVEDYNVYRGTVFLYADNHRQELLTTIIGQCKITVHGKTESKDSHDTKTIKVR